MQRKNSIKSLLASLLIFTSFGLLASEGEGGKVDTKEEVKAFIDHHLADSHYFTFFSDSEKGTHYGFPLPIIIYDKDTGLNVFMSSEFNHGEDVVKIGDKHYKLYHSKIYETDAAGTINYGESGFPTNDTPLDLSLTKNVVTMILVCFILFFMFRGLAKNYKKSNLPTGFNRVLEPLVIYVRDEIAIPNIGPKYRKYMSFLLTVFFFILLLNLLGMTPLGVNVTGNIAITFCLAMFTFFIVQFSGNKHYWTHIFWMPGVPVLMKIILMPIEILGMFTKPFALMIRLFANITAGHAVVMGLIAVIFVMQNELTTGGALGVGFLLSTFILVLKILVSFLQAFIFTMLSSLFIGSAVQEHDHH